MKRFVYCAFCAILLSLTSSCRKGHSVESHIDIDFQFTQMNVDLNVSDNPYITCVVNSAAALQEISMFVTYKDGRTEQFKRSIRKFDSPNRHSIYERPVFTNDMSSFRVDVTDVNGSTANGEVTFAITEFVTAPQITFGQDAIAFSEGDPIPEFNFEVQAKAKLSYVKVELIQSGSPMELVPVFEAFENPMSFTFDSEDYSLEEYDVNRRPSSIRVTAVDAYGKIGQVLLPVQYKPLPSPEVQVSGPGAVDEYSAVNVQGHATSETGIVSVSYYTVGEDYENLVYSQQMESTSELDFSYEVGGEEIFDYITAVRVDVQDARGKVTREEVKFSVNPKLVEVKEGDDLRAVISSMMANDKYRSVKLSVEAGSSFDLGTTSVVISKNLILESSKPDLMAGVTVNSSYVFLTDGAQVEYVRLSGIDFISEKSGSGMFNNNGGCTIKEISVERCVFEGLFSTSFVRTAGNCNIQSIRLTDSEVHWANTNGTYSMFHITNGADRVESITVSKCTIEGIFYLMYNNMTNTSFDLEVSQCTFVNQKGSANGYHVSCPNTSLSGMIVMENNLYGGTCNVKSYRVLRANKLNVKTSELWCTKSWKTFTDDTTNASVNPIAILPENEDNDDIFVDAQNGDYTLKQGTSVYNKAVGDPRWIK